MEPPLKRLRLDSSSLVAGENEHNDELSMTQAQFDVTQDPMYELDLGRAKSASKLKSAFEDIFSKYEKDFTGSDDVINFYTDKIEVDNGHVESLEARQAGASDDSLSSDEEGRILNGKSNERVKKSRSKSLILANHVENQHTSQFGSPWNHMPSMGPYRLSPFAFSSFPYGPNVPFDFGNAAFGCAPIDPKWDTPDLPVQRINYSSRGLIGYESGQSRSFGGQFDHFLKKRVTAKFSLLRAASTQEQVDDEVADDEDEEDDILLGRNSGNRSPDTQPGNAETSLVVHISKVNRDLPSHEPKRSADDKITKTSGRLSPSRRKRGLPRKHPAPISAPVPNREPENEPRKLKSSERRIEVVIPMMKRPLPTENEATEDTIVVRCETPPEVDMEPTPPDHVPKESEQTNKKREDVLISHPYTDRVFNLRSRDIIDRSPVTKDPAPLKQPNIRLEQVESPAMITESHGEKPTEITSHETSQESESSQTKDGVNPVLVDSSASEEILVQPSSQALGCDNPQTPPKETLGTSGHDADESSDPARTEEVISVAAMPESHNSDEEPLHLEPTPPPTIDQEEETRSVSVHTSNNEILSQHDVSMTDAIDRAEIPETLEAEVAIPEQEIQHPSPQHLAVCETVESEVVEPEVVEPEVDMEQGRLSPTPKASKADPNQEHKTDGIDDAQLDSSHPTIKQSTGTTESPDQDVSGLSELLNSQLIIQRVTRSSTHKATHPCRSPSPELGSPNGPEIIRGIIPRTAPPETPTKKRGARGAKSKTTPPSKTRFSFISLTSDDNDDDKSDDDDEFSIAGASTKAWSPFSHADDSPALPPLLSTPRKRTKKHGSSPSSSANRILKRSPATSRRRAVHSSPLARKVAERLLLLSSSPTKRFLARRSRSPSLGESSPRKCGKDGFVCKREFCLTCCL